ncbi:hypothetical protein ACHWQZ_G002001 [Mnemiopsis leidyi]
MWFFQTRRHRNIVDTGKAVGHRRSFQVPTIKVALTPDSGTLFHRENANTGNRHSLNTEKGLIENDHKARRSEK